MPANTDLLAELAELINQRRPVSMSRYFTEDFCLDDAGAGILLLGHAGAQQMIDNVYALAPDFHYEILDAFETTDRVAVRWRVTGTAAAGPFDVAMMAISWFSNGRISKDWGVWSGKPWQT